jgi:starch synthase (maltosyl-transferring)
LSPLIQTLDANGIHRDPGVRGKFRDLKDQVGFIFSTLGCRALHLLPIHPTPTTYARMGRFGSPYAALNFTDVDPALARFDPAATPLEQFMELVDAVHYHNGYLFLDIAINHTGWAATIHQTHPEWLVRGEDGKITAPGAWGVVWADLTKLDYTHIEPVGIYGTNISALVPPGSGRIPVRCRVHGSHRCLGIHGGTK